ncbi:unnamed protein product, partial [Prorocentrum cordatum]
MGTASARAAGWAAGGTASGAGHPSSRGRPPAVAVVGAGYLGERIVAELLMLGSSVRVYDQCLALLGEEQGQKQLDSKVRHVLSGCASCVRDAQDGGLLHLAGLPPLGPAGCGLLAPRSAAPVDARWCASVAEAAVGADIVIEAVPDLVDVKSAVFAEALSSAPQGVLLATSTLSIPLAVLRRQVAQRVASAVSRQGLGPAAARVVGLRFLAPVVFIPFVEVTLTAAQMGGAEQAHRRDLFGHLSAWGKSAFFCSVRGAAEEAEGAARDAARFLASSRVRLDEETISMRQVGEARLRHARQLGPERVAQLTAQELYNFSEPTCCACLSAPASVSSLLCGHRVLCAGC